MRLSRTPRANAAHGSFEGWSFSKLMFVWYASDHFSLQMKHRSSRTFHQVGISTDELERSRVHQNGNCRDGFEPEVGPLGPAAESLPEEDYIRLSTNRERARQPPLKRWFS